MENLKVAIIPVTPLMQNSCVIWNENTKNAAVTDPGGDLDKINDFLSKNNLNLVKIFIFFGSKALISLTFPLLFDPIRTSVIFLIFI